jgi:hypothetical protein
VLLLPLLFLSPVLPDIPNVVLRTLLSGSRCVICFIIFFSYVAILITKSTRFGLLMSISFGLLSFGYLMVMEQYVAPSSSQYLFDNLGAHQQ